MTNTMRAAVADGLGESLQVRDIDIPTPGHGQLLVRIGAAGVCHTDLSILHGDWSMRKPQFPLVPGHEGCGYVESLGEGVSGFKEGDRVGVTWLNDACGSCEFCTTGREAICPRQVGTGHMAPGTWAEYTLVSAGYAVALPEGDFADYAPIMCAGVTAYKALKELQAPPGSWVVVSGVGGTGHLAIQYARAMGLRVVAVDVEDEKLETATELGADLVFNAAKSPPVNKVLFKTGGAHGALAMSPEPKAHMQAMKMLRRGGTCVLVGVCPEMQIDVTDMILQGLTVKGSLIGNRQDLREALDFVHQGKVKPIVQPHALDDVNGAIESIRSRQVKGRAVLSPL